MSLSRKAMLACIVALLPMRAAPVLADATAATKPDQQSQEQTAQKRKTLIADATGAISETQSALKQLDDGRKKEALAALERASGKLDIILARDPSLKLAPAGVSVVTVDFQGGIDAAKQLRKQAADLIAAGRVQEARRILRNLASETVVTVASIPLATYPAAIKDAARQIDEDKVDAARNILQTALNTQVLTETIIPLPVAGAQEALVQAETLAQKKARTKEDDATLTASLDKARNQLELAQALGYGTQKDFDTMYRQLTEVREKTTGDQSGSGVFAKLKASMADFMRTNQSGKP